VRGCAHADLGRLPQASTDDGPLIVVDIHNDSKQHERCNDSGDDGCLDCRNHDTGSEQHHDHNKLDRGEAGNVSTGASITNSSEDAAVVTAASLLNEAGATPVVRR